MTPDSDQQGSGPEQKNDGFSPRPRKENATAVAPLSPAPPVKILRGQLHERGGGIPFPAAAAEAGVVAAAARKGKNGVAKSPWKIMEPWDETACLEPSKSVTVDFILQISMLSINKVCRIFLPPDTKAVKDMCILPGGSSIFTSLGKRLSLFSMTTDSVVLQCDLPNLAPQEVDPCEDVTDEDISMVIQNATDSRSALFVPEVPLEALVRRQISRLRALSLQFVKVLSRFNILAAVVLSIAFSPTLAAGDAGFLVHPTLEEAPEPLEALEAMAADVRRMQEELQANLLGDDPADPVGSWFYLTVFGLFVTWLILSWDGSRHVPAEDLPPALPALPPPPPVRDVSFGSAVTMVLLLVVAAWTVIHFGRRYA